MSNTIYETNYNEFIEKHNIDLSRLKRDYYKEPLVIGEYPTNDEIYYLYIECNLNKDETAIICNTSFKKIHTAIKKHKINKSKKLIKEKKEQTNLERYGVEHPSQSLEVKERKEQTCLKKYGVEHVTQSLEVKEKMKQTNLERYGVECSLQNNEVKEKVKQTNLERYGVEYYTQTDEFKEKSKQTNLERYGVKYVTQSVEVQRKMKQSIIKRYGIVNALQNKDILEKMKQTCLKRYGVENYSQTDEFKEKSKQTCLKNHGVEYYTQTDEFKEKSKQIMVERYGAESPLQVEEIKEKVKQTNLERYDVIYYTQTDEFKEKSKQTNLERYGFECSLQNNEVKEKSKQTLLNNYGVENIKQKHITIESLGIIQDKDKLIKFFEDNNTKSQEIIANKLGVSRVHINAKLREYGISDNYRMGGSSSYEEELVNKIREFYDGEILTNKKILDGKEIDIYLPEFNIGIEFNGDYWHSEVKLLEKNYDPKFYHHEKSMVAKNKGIFLLHIFEYEYGEKIYKYIDYIRRLMGLVNEIRTDDCIIKPLDVPQYMTFIGDNSLQDIDNTDIRLGLYYNDELVEVMGFAEIGNDEYELVNHTHKQGITTTNGMNTLFNHFIPIYNPNRVISYVSIHNQCSDIYNQLNFKYSYTIEPIFTEIGIHRIYDCGKEVWEWLK